MIAQACFFFDENKSFWWLVWGVFWSVLKVCPFFSARDFFNVAWWALSLQSNFTSYNSVSSSVSFVATIDEITNISSANHIDSFPSFCYVNCLLTFYSVYCNICSLKNNNRVLTATARRWPHFCRKFFLWLAETRKNWTFWVGFMSWTWYWNIDQTLKKEIGYTTLLLHCVGE